MVHFSAIAMIHRGKVVHFAAIIRGTFALTNILVEQIVANTWRLRRAYQIETGVLAWQYYSLKVEEARWEVRRYEKGLLGMFPPPTITDEQKHEQALQKVREIEVLRNTEIPTLGSTFIKMQDTFPKLIRYQTSVERSFYKAMDTLREMQIHRKFNSI